MAKKIYILLFTIVATLSTALATSFARVDLNRSSVYVQQPFRVTITVYTSTWFTAPLEFDNLQIPNTFIIPFSRTVPGVFTVDGRQYAGVQFYYIVFPYKVGQFTIPPLNITAQTPPEGSTVGKKITLQTNTASFTVKDVPDHLKSSNAWFVAKSASISETWTPALRNVKVGDVVKRTITINAAGTLPQFIPNITPQEDLGWASTYPQSAALTDLRDDHDANGRSTQSVTYLFEKEGTFTIPAITLSWWNPNTSRMFTKSTANIEVNVAANPNLGILTTLKDSLATMQGPVAKQAEGPTLILGMRWYTFSVVVIVLLAAVVLLAVYARRLLKFIQRKREIYLGSEACRFRAFIKKKGDDKTILQALYAWWDRIREKPSASVVATLRSTNHAEGADAMQHFVDKAYDSNTTQPGNNEVEKVKSELKKIRKEKLSYHSSKSKGVANEQEPWRP